MNFLIKARCCALISLILIVVTACVAPQQLRENIRPSWVDKPSDSNSISASASASYEIFGETKARENAILKALSMIALQKSNVVGLESEIGYKSRLISQGKSESLSEHSSVSYKAKVDATEIPVNAKIIAFWKDKVGKRVWVLMAEE